MELKKIGIRIMKTGLFVLLMSALVSCQIGKIVKEDRRIILVKGGPHEGVWQTSFVWVRYHYALDQENIQLPGVIELRGNVGHQIGRLDFLTVWVNFLDAQGKILARNTVFYSGYRIKHGKSRSFELKLKTPPGTQAMAFTYDYTATKGHR